MIVQDVQEYHDALKKVKDNIIFAEDCSNVLLSDQGKARINNAQDLLEKVFKF